MFKCHSSNTIVYVILSLNILYHLCFTWFYKTNHFKNGWLLNMSRAKASDDCYRIIGV